MPSTNKAEKLSALIARFIPKREKRKKPIVSEYSEAREAARGR